jgi:hypothetical protein
MRHRLLFALAALAALFVLPSTNVGAQPVLHSSTVPLILGGFVTVEPVRPYRSGDLVWMSSPPVAQLVTPLSSGCQRVPATGYIGTNVYADSTSEYSNYWSWGSASSGQPFYWYVKRSDESNASNGYSTGGGGSSSIAANVYHWKVQNKGSTPQAWNVCWDVL